MAYTEEYFYNADKFTSFGMFNGFPFVLEEKPDFLNIETGITTGAFNLEVSSNNFWNLAAVEVDFVLRTESTPAEYESGFAYNSNGSAETGHVVSVEYEVVNSYDTGEYLPNDRMFIEITGGFEEQGIDPSVLIVGSGADFTSIYVTDAPDLYMPIIIQPENTGAFVITLDSGVADFFTGKSGYDTRIDQFEANMLFDFGVSTLDEEGKEFNNIEYHNFPRTGYIVPKSGFEFAVEGSKIKGIYYTYPLEENPTPGNIIAQFQPPKSANAKFIQPSKNNLLGEPNSANSSTLSINKEGIYGCSLGGANGTFLSNLNPNYKSFPKNKIATCRGSTPNFRRHKNIPSKRMGGLPPARDL